MKRINKWALLLTASYCVLAVGCKDDDGSYLVRETDVIQFSSNLASSQRITLRCNGAWRSVVPEDAQWLSTTPSEGVGTGEFETIALDSVIGAIGQTVDWGTLDTGALTTTKKGTAEADALTYQTAQPDIFVGGDCYTGPKFAIDAIAAGKEAAISLHRFVHPGQTLTAGRDRRVYRSLDKEHVLLATAGFDKDHRQMPGYNAAKAKTFSDARVTFTEEQVKKECARCLGCGATKVDSYLCIGCGLCTTKCKFDAIHLKKVRDWHAGSYETMPIKVAEGVVKRAGSIVKKAVRK